MYRATADIDILADIKTEQVSSLFEALQNNFYVDEPVMRETSNNQWNDVLGIVGTSKNKLDFQYLRAWAEKLGLEEFLQKALVDVQDT